MIDNSIVKAEILWTRVCPLKCSYCSMPTGNTNSRDLDFWKRTADNLCRLGCRFAAFYGAEPLFDEDNIQKLADVLQYFSQVGIDTTIITSGIVPRLRDKLLLLHEHGLRSLTMSYDIQALDASSRAKSALAIDTLLWFKSLGVRDVATVTTLTRTNFRLLPEHIRHMSAMGIWTFFDFIHNDRKQPGSKCRFSSTTAELLFRPEDYEALSGVLNEVESLKSAGYLCNTSRQFIHLMESSDFSHLRGYDWHCAKSDAFPAWVSIDCDGSVYPCDDFHTCDRTFYSDSIAEDFSAFRDYYRQVALDKCPGCLWNTHIDANFIKEGVLPGYGIEDAKK